MMARQKEDAEVLRYGLKAGIRSVADALAWADSLIAADPHPDFAVIEVACGGNRRPREFAELLQEVPGECDTLKVMRRHLTHLRTVVAAKPERGSEVAAWLYRLALNGHLPEDEFGVEPYSLGDYFELARTGTQFTMTDALNELNALRRAARPQGQRLHEPAY